MQTDQTASLVSTYTASQTHTITHPHCCVRACAWGGVASPAPQRRRRLSRPLPRRAHAHQTASGAAGRLESAAGGHARRGCPARVNSYAPWYHAWPHRQPQQHPQDGRPLHRLPSPLPQLRWPLRQLLAAPRARAPIPQPQQPEALSPQHERTAWQQGHPRHAWAPAQAPGQRQAPAAPQRVARPPARKPMRGRAGRRLPRPSPSAAAQRGC